MLLLTVLSLPWMAVAAARAGTNIEALAAELIKPIYMTGIEASARLVAAAMGLGIVWNVMRLWSRIGGPRVGIAAGLVVATNAALVYYAHTGNLEVPYLFWTTWALLQLDRVSCGEKRECHALLGAVAAALTKDQAAAAMLLTLPVYLVVVPFVTRRAPLLRAPLVKGLLLAFGAYAVGSGAIVNPIGFRRRLGMLLGPAAHTWAVYPAGFAGTRALLRDAALATTEFTSWPIAASALVGLLFVATSTRHIERARALLPMTAAVSFFVFFNLGARRTEARFLLPESLLLFPYAALAFERAWLRWPGRSAALAFAAVASLAPALLRVASLDGTLLADARYEAERFLQRLPSGTRVEIYGGPIFMPRIPSGLAAVRPGSEPVGDRQSIPGVTDLVDPAMDPRPRAPDVILLATELSTLEMTEPAKKPAPYGLMQYRDEVSRALFRKLFDGSLGYRRALRARCSLPLPFECVPIHGSTDGEVWIYVRGGEGEGSSSPEIRGGPS